MSPGSRPRGKPMRAASSSNAPSKTKNSPIPRNALPSSLMDYRSLRLGYRTGAPEPGCPFCGGCSMQIVTMLAGIACILAVLLDAFKTIILPRRATGRFRITRIFYILTWKPWVFLTSQVHDQRQRESVFSYYGPLSLIFLLIVWAAGMVFGFALIFYSLGSPFNDAMLRHDFRSDLYVSGTSIFTLGLGDVTPSNVWSRALTILEAGTGFGFLAVVMGYFPVLYSAFSRREVSIALLDARAGSPPTAAELLRRHSYEGAENALS